MTARASSRRIAAVAALTTAALMSAACSEQTPPPAAEVLQPALTTSRTPDEPLRIGVLVPSIEGEGSEFRPQVAGVRVAAYRFGLGGTEIELSVALDDGTAAGAAAAVRSLVDGRAAGIVAATQAGHLAEALAVAQDADTAVVLPYAQPDPAADGVWSIAPSAAAVRTGVEAALTEVRAARPYLAVVPGHELDLPAASSGGTLDDARRVAQEVVAALEARQIDSVVVSGGADDQAALVIAVQELLGARQLPIVLTPQALTPAFGDALAGAGTTAGRLLSVGIDAADHQALTSSEAGEHAATFFSALRLAAGDPTCLNLYADDSCAVSTPRADASSHDALVALVRAIEAAGSTSPAEVRDALAGLSLTHPDGLVGPALDFGTAQALSDDDVVVLHASTSDPGLRPAVADGSTATSLSWFAGAVG